LEDYLVITGFVERRPKIPDAIFIDRADLGTGSVEQDGNLRIWGGCAHQHNVIAGLQRRGRQVQAGGSYHHLGRADNEAGRLGCNLDLSLLVNSLDA
jgi:hypothetical protein